MAESKKDNSLERVARITEVIETVYKKDGSGVRIQVAAERALVTEVFDAATLGASGRELKRVVLPS